MIELDATVSSLLLTILAVITVEPTETACKTPVVSLIVATAGVPETHLTEPPSGTFSAVACNVTSASPTFAVKLLSVIVITGSLDAGLSNFKR